MIKIHLFVPADRLFFEKGSDFMKLEKLSDTQIRCTLSKEDLSQRQLHLSELAYGSEKAKELLKTGLIFTFVLSCILTFFLQHNAHMTAISFLHDSRCEELLILLSYTFPFASIHS